MSDYSDEVWWKKIGIGLTNLGVSAFLYWYISAFEAAGGAWRLHWTVALLYFVAGKWIPCSVIGLIGLCCVGIGIQDWKDQR